MNADLPDCDTAIIFHVAREVQNIFQRLTFGVGNGEIPRSLWPVSMILPGAPEKVT